MLSNAGRCARAAARRAYRPLVPVAHYRESGAACLADAVVTSEVRGGAWTLRCP